MSDMNQEAVEQSTSGNSWDYLQEETPVNNTENSVVKSDEEEATGNQEEDNSKPWQSKKNETPAWARKRFKEYSTTVRDLKEQNAQLMETVKNVLGNIKPNEGKLTKEDFPDEDAYLDWKAEQKANEQLRKYDEAKRNQDEYNQRIYALQEADRRNVENAINDIPDYYEAIQNGDPDVRLPSAVIEHLSKSPAGPYVKYRIATDDELSYALKGATPQEKLSIISDLHDSVLDILIERAKSEKPLDKKVNEQRTPSVQKKAPPKAPPSVKGKGATVDLLSLSGDEYVRARREMRSNKY